MENLSGSLAMSLPDGRQASFKQLQAYGNSLQDFIRKHESMLSEVDDIRGQNETSACLQTLSSAYNNQLRIFKVQEAENQRRFISSLNK